MRIRNISGYDLEVPSLGRMVPDGEVTEIPDEATESFVCQPATWEAVDPYTPPEPDEVEE